MVFRPIPALSIYLLLYSLPLPNAEAATYIEDQRGHLMAKPTSIHLMMKPACVSGEQQDESPTVLQNNTASGLMTLPNNRRLWLRGVPNRADRYRVSLEYGTLALIEEGVDVRSYFQKEPFVLYDPTTALLFFYKRDLREGSMQGLLMKVKPRIHRDDSLWIIAGKIDSLQLSQPALALLGYTPDEEVVSSGQLPEGNVEPEPILKQTEADSGLSFQEARSIEGQARLIKYNKKHVFLEYEGQEYRYRLDEDILIFQADPRGQGAYLTSLSYKDKGSLVQLRRVSRLHPKSKKIVKCLMMILPAF